MGKNANAVPKNPLQQKYDSARSNLMVMIAFTLINIVMLLFKTDTMFLFSATIPYFYAILAVEIGALAGSYLTYFTAITIAIIAAYILCWIFSKKHYGWMIAALVMFAVDTLFLIYVYISAGDVSGIIDALFHVYVLYYLITGVISGVKLKKAPAEMTEAVAQAEEIASDDAAQNLDNNVF